MKQVVRQVAFLLAFAGALLYCNSASALSQTRSAGSCSNWNISGSQAWYYANSATVSDDDYAITVLNDQQTSNFLRCLGYGFNIPTGAVITGITLRVERAATDSNISDASVRLIKASNRAGADKATDTDYSQNSDSVQTYGGSTDLWSTTWTAADINNANFGAAISSRKRGNSGGARYVGIDHVSITVDYTVNTPPPTPSCAPPPNTPAGLEVSCVCDNFGRATLNPSTIFGGNWTLSNSDSLGNPYINQTSGKLRLTERTNNNAKAATVPGIFPAAGNYISVEFYHYAYYGTNPGADGIAVTLSDYSIPAVPGGFGGSLGYAPRNDGNRPPGFAGGWLGVALDEYGNYQNPTEGRTGGPGFRSQSIGVRGPGKGANGYRWMTGTASNPGGTTIDSRASTTPAPGYLYQVIVDATRSANGVINVQVNRDSTNKDGSAYQSLFTPFNAYTEAAYALNQGWIDKLLPDYWKVSFTGSTGGSTNIHEIGGLRICAQTIAPPTGGIANGFAVIDEAYPTAPNSTVPAYQDLLEGHIYMKLTGVPFKLWVAALTDDGISTAYSAGSAKHVSVKLVDNTDGVCGTDTNRQCTAACASKAAVEAGGERIVAYSTSDRGGKRSPDFTLNSAWKNLVAIVRECTTSACSAFTTTRPACSADSFSVRPTGIASVISSNATNASTSGSPVFKAGSENFTLAATTVGVTVNGTSYPSRYTGVMKINSDSIEPISPGGGIVVVPGTVTSTSGTDEFPPALSGTPSSTATGTFTYSEVGAFKILGANFSAATPRGPGVYDDTWSEIDSELSRNDCVSGSGGAAYSNVKNADGKYGCNFGLMTDSGIFGRFIPDHFQLGIDGEPEKGEILNRSELGPACTPASVFTYMGEPFRLTFKLTAKNKEGETTRNYAGGYAKLTATNWLNFNVANSVGVGMIATDYPVAPGTCKAVFSNSAPYSTTFACTPGVTPPAPINRTTGSPVGPRVAVLGTPAAPSWIDGVGTFAADLVLERADRPDGPYAKLNVGVAPVDADGIRLGASDLDVDNDGANERGLVATTQVRYGRMLISNAYGSESLPLPVQVRAQYWNGTAWANNLFDNCTPLAAANFTRAQGAGATITNTVAGGGMMTNGAGVIGLTKPSNTVTGRGSVILSTSTTSPTLVPLDRYIPGKGIETFGTFKSGPVIYLRELY